MNFLEEATVEVTMMTMRRVTAITVPESSVRHSRVISSSTRYQHSELAQFYKSSEYFATPILESRWKKIVQ